METDLVPVAKDAIIKAVNEEVYQSYQPKIYQRRFSNSGIGDIREIDAVMLDDSTLHVRSNADINRDYPFVNQFVNSMQLDEQIVRGMGYTWSGPFSKPRDFYSTAQENLEELGEHIEAMKRGLEKQGFKINNK